jgi:hypothetical protein
MGPRSDNRGYAAMLSSTVTLLSVWLSPRGREGTGRGVPVIDAGLFRPTENPADFLGDLSRTRWLALQKPGEYLTHLRHC